MSKQRIQYLEEQIKYHNKKYWIDNNPEISDYAFDLLIRELKELDPYNINLNYIGQILSQEKKIKLKYPMLSLDKVYSKEELIKWMSGVSRLPEEEFIFEPKFDGVSASYYKKLLVTRGDDGIYGENITHTLPIITVDSPNYYGPLIHCHVDLRGEIILTKSSFESNKNKIKRRDGEPFKTPRNACCGLLNRDEFSEIKSTILILVDYDTYQQEITIDDLINKSFNFEEYCWNIENSDYPADGIVIKLKDKEWGKLQGSTGHHPKDQIAFKFENPKAETELLDIEWSYGKQSITPVGKLKPVQISGVTIQNVSLHNLKFIIDNKIFIGDTLIIERAGDIIPHVIKVKPGKERKKIQLSLCFRCGSKLIYEEPELKCSNINCSGNFESILLDSAKRIGLGIGEPTIKKMIDQLQVKNLIDILNLKTSDILLLEGFAFKSADSLAEEISNIKNNPINDWKILGALNIPGLGIGLSKKLLEVYTLKEILETDINICNIPNFSIEREIQIKKYLQKNRQYFENFLNLFIEIVNTKQENKTELIKVCFTGSADITRNELFKIAEKHNIECVNAITKDLNYLVTNDLHSQSSKMNRAKKFGIKIITYNDFFKLLN